MNTQNAHTRPRIPPDRHTSLMKLLSSVGPYRRDQLRKQLLSGAQSCCDEADSLRRSNSAFRSATGFPRTELLTLPSTRPTTPEGWESEAAILQAMAEIVSTFRPTFPNPN